MLADSRAEQNWDLDPLLIGNAKAHVDLVPEADLAVFEHLRSYDHVITTIATGHEGIGDGHLSDLSFDSKPRIAVEGQTGA
jgi:hypothetical protein